MFFTCFSHIQLRNFDSRMFVLRSSISVQVSKKMFEIINKRGGVQISIWMLEKKQKIITGGGRFLHGKIRMC